MSNNEALNIAIAADTHGTVLHSLRNHEDASVRTAVAKNTNTYPSTLRLMARDSDIWVLGAVAVNENAHRLHRTIAKRQIQSLL